MHPKSRAGLLSVFLLNAAISPALVQSDLIDSGTFYASAAAREAIKAIKWREIPLARDDAGTGYASISPLQQDIAALKVNQCAPSRLITGSQG